MHPRPQDGSPGRFPDAGCVANQIGLIGIRTCGRYNMIWVVARQPNILFYMNTQMGHYIIGGTFWPMEDSISKLFSFLNLSMPFCYL